MFTQFASLPLPFFIASLLLCGPMYAKEVEEGSVRLVLEDFNALSASPEAEILSKGFPDMLRITLLPYSAIQVVDRGDLWRTLIFTLKRPEHEYRDRGKDQRIFEEDVISHQNINPDYVLRGSFFEIGNFVQVRAVLHNRRSDEKRLLGPFRFPTARILEDMDIFARQLVKILTEENAVEYRPRTAAVACFRVEKADEFFAPVPMGQDLASFLYFYLEATSPFRILEWVGHDDSCQDFASLFSTYGDQPDLLLHGTIVKRNGQLIVFPFLRLTELDLTIPIVPRQAPYSSYTALKRQLSTEVDSLLGTVLRSDGSWQVNEFVPLAKDSSDFLERARAALDKGEARDLRLAEYFLRMGLRHLQDVEEKESRSEFRYLLGRTLYERSAASEFERGRLQQAAKRQFDKAVEDDPHRWEAYVGLGKLYLEWQQMELAVKNFTKAKEISPEELEPYRQLAIIYALQEEFGKANRELKALVKERPRKADSRALLARLNKLEGNLKGAEKNYESALSVASGPERESIRLELADLHLELADMALQEGDYQGAVSRLSSSVRFRESLRAVFLRGQALVHLAEDDRKMLRRAHSDFSRAMVLSREAPEDMGYYAWSIVSLAETYLLQGQYAEADRTARLAIEKFGSEPSVEAAALYILLLSTVMQGADGQPLLDQLEQRVASEKYTPEFRGLFFDVSPVKRHLNHRPDLALPVRQELMAVGERLGGRLLKGS